ncbi:hypothetical protein [Siphonobacter curvatus]|uniref:Uncharacterized protein n=1 Tax=Siphonobacter curvatus TaxID=2094562 RepID=A0A2S7IRW7_9BACT|nr:hypothetical protein [Siphonobacter curvatus]PQA60330.1 hypothetical protein C5O19_12140 [Siphonobacter curvatus]
MTTLLLKLILMPSLIGGVTLAARRWGNVVGGWLGGFPWIAGPISIFLALEQSKGFAAQSAAGSLLGCFSTYAFAWLYAKGAARLHWFPLLMGCYAMIFVSLYLGQFYTGSIHVLFVALLLFIALVYWKFPRPAVPTHIPPPPRFDLPLRMLVATVFVAGITQLAAWTGPVWSGLLTPFPIMTTCLAVFTHIQQGPAQCARILRGMVSSGFGFAAFLYGVGLLLPHTSLWVAYSIALLFSSLTNLLTLKFLK